MSYTSDLSVPQFELLEQLLATSKTRGYKVSRHLIVNAILYQLKNGCQWRDLPSDFPNWRTVYLNRSECSAACVGDERAQRRSR